MVYHYLKNNMHATINIAIFASGNGTNAQKIMEYFSGNEKIKIALVLSNKKDAYVLERAKMFKVEYFAFNKSAFYETNKIIDILDKKHIDLIVLAGFLWLVPEAMIIKYPDKIINIHPALLPKYGGKGMYGTKVHQTVLEAKEKKSGITIHYVNRFFDEGEIIFQAECDVYPNDTPENLAERVHELEYKYFAPVIEDLVLRQK